MNFKSEFQTALGEGKDHDALLELVNRYQAEGLSSQEAYQVLHQLWLECGFNDVEQPSALQDNLEFVLEKVWYECPAAD